MCGASKSANCVCAHQPALWYGGCWQRERETGLGYRYQRWSLATNPDKVPRGDNLNLIRSFMTTLTYRVINSSGGIVVVFEWMLWRLMFCFAPRSHDGWSSIFRAKGESTWNVGMHCLLGEDWGERIFGSGFRTYLLAHSRISAIPRQTSRIRIKRPVFLWWWSIKWRYLTIFAKRKVTS